MKTLNDVINAVQHETQLSRSQLSLKIGKSRNYLNTTVKNGLSYDKEQEVISLLLELVDDEVAMLRNVLADKEETVEAYRLKVRSEESTAKRFEEHCEKLQCENFKLSETNDKLSEENKFLTGEVYKLNNEIATKNLFIDGLDMENKGLMDRISDLEKDISVTLDNEKSLQKTIESLEKAGHATGKQLNKEITKNRILTASIIGLVAIFSVYLWVK